MKYWYLYNLTDDKPINASYQHENKLILYTKESSAKRGFTNKQKYNHLKHDIEIKTVEF